MDAHRPETSEDFTVDLQRWTLSRRQLIQAAAAGAALVAVPGVAAAQTSSPYPPGSFSFPFFPQITSGTYTTEGIQDILNNVVTGFYLAVIRAYRTVENASTFGLTGWELGFEQASVAKLQYQIDFLNSLGASAVTTTFTLPAGATSRPAFLATAETATNLAVAVTMTASREFAELGQPTLAKWMYQLGAAASEQRAIFRTLQAIDGNPAGIPPNNKAFATDLFLYTRDLMTVLKRTGLVGGSTPPVSYPGRDAILAAAGPMAVAIIQRRPNDATSTVTITGPASLNGERP